MEKRLLTEKKNIDIKEKYEKLTGQVEQEMRRTHKHNKTKKLHVTTWTHLMKKLDK